MGIRGELYSTRITCEGRTYFFNVKENRMGDLFLTIVESKPTEADNFDRRSVVVFRDDMSKFIGAFQNALDFMSSGKGVDKAAKPRFAGHEGKAPARKTPAGFAGSADPAAGPEGSSSPGKAAPAKKRRIVVKKKPAAGGGKA